MGKLKFGWSEVSITPEGRKISLAGQFYERITDVVESPLTVTSLAIESDGEAAIITSVDAVSTSHSLLDLVREIIKEKAPDFPTDRLMVGAIHSHTAMSYSKRGDSGALGGSSLDVLKQYAPEGVEYKPLVSDHDDSLLTGDEARAFLAERIAKSAIEAWNNRSYGCYAPGFGRAVVGHCRRVCYDDGSALMWGDTNSANFAELEAGSDSGIELMYVFDENKKLTGVVANVACPAQVLEHRNFISSDYWGKVKQFVREKLGDDIYILALCSAAGDQCPRDMIRWVEPETPINDPNVNRDSYIPRDQDPSMFDLSGCIKAGKRVAREILDVYEEIDSYITEAPFYHEHLKIDIPLRRVSIAEKNEAEKHIREFFEKSGGSFDFRDNARMHIYAGTIARYNLQQKRDLVEIEVHVMRLGNLAFATNPYELFINYGNQIRARSLARQTFLIQLCCGSFGYLPTEKAEKGSHYSAYVSSGTAGHEGGDLLVRKTTETINKLMNK